MLQARNPQDYQRINQMMQNNANPLNLIQQLVSNSNAPQMQNILGQAKQMGVPDNVLSQIQNIKR